MTEWFAKFVNHIQIVVSNETFSMLGTFRHYSVAAVSTNYRSLHIPALVATLMC